MDDKTMDWERYHATHPLTIGRTDYLTQVGHTVGGKPISQEHFGSIVSQIISLLDLEPSDAVLDLCCGNGLITKELAVGTERVLGVDFSKPLLDIAMQDHQPDNVSYQLLNVLDLVRTPPRSPRKFNKVVMYAALQHFSRTDLRAILEGILRVSAKVRTIVFGFVPDRSRKWSFYDSPSRKLAHFAHRARGSDRIGTWWDSQHIRTVCREMKLNCSFHNLDPMLHASKYRFDVRITERTTTE